VVIVPAADGSLVEPDRKGRELDPRIRQKLVRALPLRRLAIVSALLLVSLLGGFYILVRRSEARGAETEPKLPPKLTLERVAEENRLLAMPLGRGFIWQYALAGGGTEERKVAFVSMSAEGTPEADLAISGSSVAVKQTLRVTLDGVYLVAESRAGERTTLVPPLKVVPHPMHTDDAWSYRGDCVREGGGAERWELDSSVEAVEPVDSGVGKLACFRVTVKGSRGFQPVDETLWYAKGVGLVRRRTALEGRVEEAILQKFSHQ
jgi:hypothetical protein